MIELLNGNCLELMKNIPDRSIDFVLTDPPYELETCGGVGHSALSKRIRKVRVTIDFMLHGFNYDAVFNELIRVCKIPNILIFCSRQQLGKTITWFENKKLKTDTFVWKKTNPAPLCNSSYVSDLEYMVYVYTAKRPFNNDAPFEFKKKGKVYPLVTNKLHPTQKPLKLIEELITVHSFEDMTILDPFMGSGTTGVACKNLNRNFIGIELNEEYFQIAKRRINDSK